MELNRQLGPHDLEISFDPSRLFFKIECPFKCGAPSSKISSGKGNLKLSNLLHHFEDHKCSAYAKGYIKSIAKNEEVTETSQSIELVQSTADEVIEDFIQARASVITSAPKIQVLENVMVVEEISEPAAPKKQRVEAPSEVSDIQLESSSQIEVALESVVGATNSSIIIKVVGNPNPFELSVPDWNPLLQILQLPIEFQRVAAAAGINAHEAHVMLSQKKE